MTFWKTPDFDRQGGGKSAYSASEETAGLECSETEALPLEDALDEYPSPETCASCWILWIWLRLA